MKISYNWLREYIDTTLSVEEIAEVLTAVGLEVESVDKVETIPGGLKGVVVGEVLECEKHPDADRLRLTKVNIGDGEPVQIVCGAPNVAAGQKVLVATIGTKLFPTEGEPLVIKKGKIRGQESHGMICAEDELGLGKSHEGIMVLDASAGVGTPAAQLLNISEDHCLEIGLTPNRTDAFSHYGVARDLHAALRNMKGVKKAEAHMKPISVASFKEGTNNSISVEVKDVEACPRYSGVTIKGIKVGPSPKWLQDRLNTIGLRPINNIVDITNYVQHEMGQPLHAFDASKISGNKVIVRLAGAGEKFVTLDGVERELNAQDLMICDEKNPMCIAGVFGGIESGVTENTTDVFLESAYFNPVNIRKTAKRHGLHTDASFRFERGCDPSATVDVLKRAALLISEIAGGEVDSPVTDIYPKAFINAKVDLNWARLYSLIGKEIDRDDIKHILEDLDIHFTAETAESIQLEIPLYRTDVTREADVAEEILRIYGYDNIEFPKGLKSSLSFAPKPDPEKIQEKISDLLTANGFSEMMSMSLTKVKYLEYANEESAKNSVVEILNPLSNDLGVMRQNLLYSGLEAIALNQNHRNSDLKLYEFGKTYFHSGDKYSEEKHLSIYLTGKRFPEGWNNKPDEVSFPDLKGILENIFTALGIGGIQFSSSEDKQFSDGLECYQGKLLLGKLGSVSAALLKEFDVKQQVWFADLQWENIIRVLPKNKIQYREADKYPAVRRDLSLLLDKPVTYSEIEKTAYESEKKLLRAVNLFDVYEGKNLDAGKKSYAVSFMLQDSTKTMTDSQVDQVMEKIRKSLEEKLGATLR